MINNKNNRLINIQQKISLYCLYLVSICFISFIYSLYNFPSLQFHEDEGIFNLEGD